MSFQKLYTKYTNRLNLNNKMKKAYFERKKELSLITCSDCLRIGRFCIGCYLDDFNVDPTDEILIEVFKDLQGMGVDTSGRFGELLLSPRYHILYKTSTPIPDDLSPSAVRTVKMIRDFIRDTSTVGKSLSMKHIITSIIKKENLPSIETD